MFHILKLMLRILLYLRNTTENDSKIERFIGEVQTPNIGAYWFVPEPTDTKHCSTQTLLCTEEDM